MRKRIFKINFYTLVLFKLLTTCTFVLAHESTDETDVWALESTLKFFGEAVRLEPHLFAREASSPSYPSVQVAPGVYFKLDTPVFELTAKMIGFLIEERRNECSSCLPPEADVLVQEFYDVVARGAFLRGVADPFRDIVVHRILSTAEHIIEGGIDLGTQYGRTIFVLKIAGEIGETFLTLFTPLKGAHIFCNAIDFTLLFATRNIQIYSSIFSNSRHLNKNALFKIIHYGWISSKLKKVTESLTYEGGPYELDEEALREIDKLGPGRWWGFASEGKRFRWFKDWHNKRSKLRNQSSSTVTLQRKRYLGRRYLFFIPSRQHLNGSSDVERANQRDFGWILSFHAGQFSKVFSSASSSASLDTSSLNSNAENFNVEPVMHFLASQFSNSPEQLHQKLRVLSDIETIFDPNSPRALRFAIITAIENLFNGHLRQIILHQLEDSVLVTSGRWDNQMARSFERFFVTMGVRLRVGSYSSEVFSFANYLRSIALIDDEETLFSEKYQAMDYYLKLFRHLAVIHDFLEERSPHQGRNYNVPLKTQMLPLRESLHDLQTARPWQEKLQGFWRYPRCEDMAEVK